MKKIKYLVLPLIAFSLCSCHHYKAFMLITENHGNNASMRFDEFEGEYIFKLKKKDAGEGPITYEASLEEGSVDVTYIIYGTESLLFTIRGGESLRNQWGYVEKGQKVQIIVKSNCKSTNGNFTFNLN